METQTDQISTKEFLKSVFSYFGFLGKNWQILLIVLLIGNFYDLFKNNYFKSSVDYGGKIEFNIDLDGGGAAAGGMGGLATAIGLPTGGKNSGLMDATNFPKILLSKTVFQNAFVKEIELYGRKDLFINFFIDSSDIKHKEWAGNLFRGPSSYAQTRFVKKDPADFTPYENQVANDVYLKLKDQTTLEKEQGTSIYILQSVLTNELLTKTWLDLLLSTTEDFYTEMKTLKTRKLIKIQERRIDSLNVLLRSNDRSLSRSTFEQPDVVNPYAGMSQSRLTRDNTYLSNVYLSNLNSLEGLKNLLVEQSEIFHILTPAALPLIPTEKVGISVRLTGLILLVATIFILSIRKTYIEIMSDKS